MHGQLELERVLLGHEPEAGADLGAVASSGRGRARVSSPAVGGEMHDTIFIVDVLPAPFGPRKPKLSPGVDLEVDAVDGREVAEALHQPACGDERRAFSGARHGGHAIGRGVTRRRLGSGACDILGVRRIDANRGER